MLSKESMITLGPPTVFHFTKSNILTCILGAEYSKTNQTNKQKNLDSGLKCERIQKPQQAVIFEIRAFITRETGTKPSLFILYTAHLVLFF